MADLIVGLYEDWLWFDERIETLTVEIETIPSEQASCRRLMSVPGVGPMTRSRGLGMDLCLRRVRATQVGDLFAEPAAGSGNRSQDR